MTTHFGFIFASYLIATAAIGGLGLAIWLEHRRLRRELASYGAGQRESNPDSAA